MPNTIKDAKSAALGAMLDIQIAVQDFAAEWLEPEIRRAQAMIDQNILNQWDAHQAELEQVKAQNPDAYEKALAQVNALRKQARGG